MQFLFLGTPKPEFLRNPPANLMDAVRGDWAKSQEYFGRGIFRQLWTSDKGIAFVCEADSPEQLKSYLDELLMAQANLIDIEIRELQPYRGFTPIA